MKSMKKLIAILLSLILLLGVCAAAPVTVSAAASSLSVCGERIDLDSDGTYCGGKVEYNGATHTLTFDDFDLVYDGVCISARFLGFDLTIRGSAKLTSSANGVISSQETNLIIDCESLFFSSPNGKVAFIDKASVTFNGGSVYLTGSSDTGAVFSVSGKITVNGGSLSAVNIEDSAIVAGESITVNGGSVYAKTGIVSYNAIGSPDVFFNNGETYVIGNSNASEVLIKAPGTLAGAGTEDIPYMIFDYSDLKAFALKVNGGETSAHAKLMKDITADDSTWVAIGNENDNYSGVFDGCYHTITGLSNADFGNNGPSQIGLFGFINGSGCKVMNTGIINADFKASINAGGVVGYNGGTVKNCFNSDSCGISGGHAGGVVGNNFYFGTVENCYNSGPGSISGYSDAGGVVGYNVGTVKYCYNSGSGNITADGNAGGVVGMNIDTVTNCYYDRDSCIIAGASADNNWNATGNNTIGTVTGLTKAEMTAGTYTDGTVTNMPGFTSETWLVKEKDSDYSYYPHLKGFNLDDGGVQIPAENITAENWPPKNMKEEPEMTFSVTPGMSDDGYNIIITVTLPGDATGTVSATISGDGFSLGENSGNNPSSQVENGKAEILFTGLKAGTQNNITVLYSGDNNYKEATAEIDYYVMELVSDSVYDNVKPVIYVYGSGGTDGDIRGKKVSISILGSNDEEVAAAEVEFTEYIGRFKVSAAIWEVPFLLEPGEYKVIAQFAEQEEGYICVYYGSSSLTVLDREEPDFSVSAGNVDYGQNSKASAILPSDATGTVTFCLDNAESGKKVNVNNGKAECEFEGVIPGSHSVSAVYSGDKKYKDKTATCEFSVNPVNCPLTINYVYSDGGEATDTFHDQVEIFGEYNVPSPVITGYTADPAEVKGTMGDADLNGKTVTVTYTANTYKVKYVVDGDELTSMDVIFGQSVPQPRTPQKEGYTFAWTDEIPDKMPAEDITINGSFTIIKYVATFVKENGDTYDTREYTFETTELDEPAVPEKQGYEGRWEEYELTPGGITVKPAYTIISAITLNTEGISETTGYKEDQTFKADIADLPEGAEVHWFVNGEDAGTGSSCTVEDPTGDYTVQAKIIDSDGTVLAESEIQSVHVKNGFYDKLKAFFAELFEIILGKTIADLLFSIC